MNLKSILAAIAIGIAASSASATVLTFDTLTEMMYGDGFPLAGTMSYDGADLSYEESGFKLTLHAPNAAPGLGQYRHRHVRATNLQLARRPR